MSLVINPRVIFFPFVFLFSHLGEQAIKIRLLNNSVNPVPTLNIGWNDESWRNSGTYCLGYLASSVINVQTHPFSYHLFVYLEVGRAFADAIVEDYLL